MQGFPCMTAKILETFSKVLPEGASLHEIWGKPVKNPEVNWDQFKPDNSRQVMITLSP